MSRVRNVSRQWLQEKGREPTLEEVARRAETTVEEARRVLAMSRYPISLDRPVGNSEDSHFGDLLPDGGLLLGEIVISLDAARRQAVELGHSELRELEELVLHGTLHLLGHDHEQDDGEMEDLELRLREELLG